MKKLIQFIIVQKAINHYAERVITFLLNYILKIQLNLNIQIIFVIKNLYIYQNLRYRKYFDDINENDESYFSGNEINKLYEKDNSTHKLSQDLWADNGHIL